MLLSVIILWFNLTILDLHDGGVIIISCLENFLQLCLNSEYGGPHIGGKSAHFKIIHPSPVSYRQLGNGVFLKDPFQAELEL